MLNTVAPTGGTATNEITTTIKQERSSSPVHNPLSLMWMDGSRMETTLTGQYPLVWTDEELIEKILKGQPNTVSYRSNPYIKQLLQRLVMAAYGLTIVGTSTLGNYKVVQSATSETATTPITFQAATSETIPIIEYEEHLSFKEVVERQLAIHEKIMQRMRDAYKAEAEYLKLYYGDDED